MDEAGNRPRQRPGTGILGGRTRVRPLLLFASTLCALGSPGAHAGAACERDVVANVVAFDQAMIYSRLGVQNVNGMTFALKRDVVDANGVPLTHPGATPAAGQVSLRPDKRNRQLVLRVRQGDCLTVNLTNLLTPAANPTGVRNGPINGLPIDVDEQVAERRVSFHAQGMQLVNSIADDGSNVGRNATLGGNSLAGPGQSVSYKLYAEREGVFLAQSYGAVFGSEGTQGNSTNGLWGQVIVEPRGARSYRSIVTEEELRLATVGTTPTGQPKINYEAVYPNVEPWVTEGKAGLPVLNMMRGSEIVHSEIDAINVGPNADGSFPPSTYPLESTGKRNPSVPNRLEPFRDFATGFHDEVASAQAFMGFYVHDPVFRYVLAGVKDAFMINMGSGGIGSEIIANRLGVGPMHDCLDCAYEEFFLTSFTVSDPGTLVDVPANAGLEDLLPGQAPPPGTTGPKASMTLFPGDPANIHHSYTGDFVKFRNTHVGKEHHVFHLHNHQWLFNPNDDNSNYIDAQSIGPGSGYTYEIAFGGSGNRNKTAGDAIYHCHFYPHFAQGMWYHWRNHDVTETGTVLAVTPNDGDGNPTGYHTRPWALREGAAAPHARALPDGEVVSGAAIPAVVPLPGKAMAPMPGKVELVANPHTKVASTFHPTAPGQPVPVGSLAKVVERNKNPGFPFWVAGVEDAVGQRPPTPPLDMLDPAKAAQLRDSGNPLWVNIDPNQAGGWDGGLPRHALQGYAAGGLNSVNSVSRTDFSKVIGKAQAVFYPEEGTDVEQVAMAFHATRNHPSSAVNLDGTVVSKSFVVNGQPPVAGAPFHEPCVDDRGVRMTGGSGFFFSGDVLNGMNVKGASPFSANAPRVYKGANIQFDAVLNKVGYHYPQQRIVALWEDAMPVINKQKAPEPLVMRNNTFDCTMYHHTNLVPEYYEVDDYQVRTPTDIIGQHIHLPKWDLTTTDGAANGWNYEDGTLSPGAVQERIHAINIYAEEGGTHLAGAGSPETFVPPQHLAAKPHPYFGQFGRPDWMGARTTLQRWFFDPVANVFNNDRGLGIIFSHDHYGPSTHQQVGLYTTVMTEPAGSTWIHSETGEPMYTRADGGPTSWQAAIVLNGDVDGDGKNDSYREFYFEYSDFQHAYEAGVYVGADQNGVPIAVPALANGSALDPAQTFRNAINPPGRGQIAPVYPDLVVELAGGLKPFCPVRPCPQAIDVEDPGVHVVNYRQEPIGLRVFDPLMPGPDGKPGAQAAGKAGDLAFALQSRTDRAIALLNENPSDFGPGRKIEQVNGTRFPPPINAAGTLPGDPFTPLLRTYSGDRVRVKVQAGGDEEEHNVTLHGMKWLQGGSSFGRAPHSGWRNAQSAGISEQFAFSSPVFMSFGTLANTADYLYATDASNDGYWSGVWGIMRNYNDLQAASLYALPNNVLPIRPVNGSNFNGICPTKMNDKVTPVPQRYFDITAVLANDILPYNADVSMPTEGDVASMHMGGPLDPTGGTLVYNPRVADIPGVSIAADAPGEDALVLPSHRGPLHDPTAILYVRTGDMVDPANPKAGLKPGVPVEPLVLRAAAGDCINVTLRNRLPLVVPDLATLSTLQGIVKRDRNGTEGSTTFNMNLIRASSHVGLHPQLVDYDVTQSDGANVGINPEQTAPPGGVATYKWFAGDLSLAEAPRKGDVNHFNRDTVLHQPVEFGGSNLMPADKIKQGAKGLVGAMIVEPYAAAWTEDADQRAAATVSAPGQATYRDFALVLQKSVTQYYGDGAPVEHMNGEGMGIPEDSQDATGMALNYGIEPAWYRYGIHPSAPYGHAGGHGYGDAANAGDMFSNSLYGPGGTMGDPATPIFTAPAGSPFRIHAMQPYGTSRGSVFQLHGHLWPKDPYLAQNVDALGYPAKKFGVGSVRIGNNPMQMYLGGQESWTPASHWSFVMPSAGGANAIPGDYLFRDQGGLGTSAGVWGILRVQ